MYDILTERLPIGFIYFITLFLINAIGSTYYIDSEGGNDLNDGLATGTAWKTLTKVNSTTFAAGSHILFKAGGSWTGQLYPKGAGTENNPTIIDMYGTGKKPLIAADGAGSAVHLLNQPYWEINNLEITNKAVDWGDYHGISVNGKEFGTINHIYIKNCYIHDVHGVVAWIGNSGQEMTGVINTAGWDESKHSGGIVFDILSPSSVKTNFNDIVIENNIINDCSFGGICIKQRQGSVGWGGRSSASDSKWFPHTDLKIRNNYLSQYNNDHGCNTMYITNVRNGIIENNVCAHSGVSAIELYYTDNFVVQKNETYGSVHRCNSADYNGIDADRATTKTIFQYNYIHDNGDGFLFCQIGFGDVIVRYNILQNNTRHGLNLHSDTKSNAQIYNNVVYTKHASSIIANSSGGASSLNSGTYLLRNNIFYSTVNGPTVSKGTYCTYDNNCYYGVAAASGDAHKVTSNPLFVNAGTGGDGDTSGWAASTLDGYTLQSGSPCIDTGVSISDNGKTDFWGGTLYNGTPDIGAHEFGSDPMVTKVLKAVHEYTVSRYIPATSHGLNGMVFSLDGKKVGFIKQGKPSAYKSINGIKLVKYGNKNRKTLFMDLSF